MKLAVLGAGLMGRAAVYDLSRLEDVEAVGVFDIDGGLAQAVAGEFGNGKATAGQLNAADQPAVTKVLEGVDGAISCVTYALNGTLSRAAIAAGCHLVDLGGNNDMVREQLALDAKAAAAGVLIVPDCGLAPGMVSVLVADAVARMESVRTVKIRVGGLPQHPQPPLNYQMVFSAEGLINEYWESCVILEGGRKKIVEPMTDVEALEFESVGRLEAFYTSGGTSTLPDTYEGKIDFLDYKTIRYPGHCALFRPMLQIGLASREKLTVDGAQVSPREVFKRVLETSLSYGDLDMVLVRVTAEGKLGGAEHRVVYEVVDRQKSNGDLTAMMRMTSFPACIVLWMIVSGHIVERGCKPQEQVVDSGVFISELEKRDIELKIA
jgi:lysine 6-dehydrogenase